MKIGFILHKKKSQYLLYIRLGTNLVYPPRSTVKKIKWLFVGLRKLSDLLKVLPNFWEYMLSLPMLAWLWNSVNIIS